MTAHERLICGESGAREDRWRCSSRSSYVMSRLLLIDASAEIGDFAQCFCLRLRASGTFRDASVRAQF